MAGLHCTAMLLVKGMDDLSHWTPLQHIISLLQTILDNPPLQDAAFGQVWDSARSVRN